MSIFLGAISVNRQMCIAGIGATKRSNKRVFYSLTQGLKEVYKTRLQDLNVFAKSDGKGGYNVWFKKDGIFFNFQTSTGNSKTGNMIQTNMYPEEWIKKGQILSDKKICFDCPHSQNKNATCYVRKGTSAMGMSSKIRSITKDYSKIPEFNADTLKVLTILCSGRPVRFGSYGEPVLLGKSLIEKITEVASTWTGYTHQWINPKYDWAKEYFMASVESQGQMATAKLLGWRTFYVNTDKAMDKTGLVVCPASKEGGKKSICEDCNLCKGASSKAKSIVINKH
jgi:hypothetical protein